VDWIDPPAIPATTRPGGPGLARPGHPVNNPGMELLDVTVPIRPGMVIFEGDPDVNLSLAASIDRGDIANTTRIDMGAHTGTHVDAPVHFIPGGAGVDSFALDTLIGPAVVVDARGATGLIEPGDLAGVPEGAERVLFLTTNSALWERDSFSTDFVAIAPEAATALAGAGVKLVGIDYLSVGKFGHPGPTHRALLEAGVVIIEGLDLRGVEPGEYHLTCLPLRLEGRDGAPARVVLGRRTGAE
jgi:arylformamidase